MYFRGDIPCKPHKEFGVHCSDCSHYKATQKRILIIKLGALGDVIRTTPLVTRYKKMIPNAAITWLTLTPDILPQEHIEEILPFTLASITYLQEAHFDIAINLDKEKEACALLNRVQASEKYGYFLKDNKPAPINALAEHKFNTGIFDDISKKNTLDYCSEIFAICNMEYDNEPYLLNNYPELSSSWTQIDRSKKIIGLNTGCGGRWTTRLWPQEYFVDLATQLLDDGYEVLLLGGEQEHERNTDISFRSGAKYLGFFPLKTFINLVDQCHVVVTQVTMGMHIALGLGKGIVLMNNIFNPHEFNLFSKGEIVEPNKPCDCFYQGSCKNGKSCMYNLPVTKVYDSLKRII